MSSRPVFKPHPVVVAGDMSASITSDVTIINMLSMVSYSVSWNGTAPVGTIAVEVSNDYQQAPGSGVINAGTWTALPLSITPAVSGNTDSGFIDIDATAGYAIRLRYIRTSGTGTLAVIVSGKVA